MSKRSGNPAKRAWQPLVSGEANPRLVDFYIGKDKQPEGTTHRAWGNDIYQVFASTFPDDSMHLSIRRHDRRADRDWRHLQAIKNEVAGPEREAFEIFPRESRMVDGSNQFHLWVIPPGLDIPMGYFPPKPEIATDEQIVEWNKRDGTQAVQRPWEEGLPTGPGVGSVPLQPEELPRA